MKLLVLIRGYHCQINGKGPISWRDCYNSLKKNYLDYYQDCHIDIYFLTYKSPELNDLIKTYKPVNYLAYEQSKIHLHNQVNNMYNLLSIVENPYKYDQILFTRFDILYKIPVSQWRIENDKIMIPFFHPNHNYCDTFYIIPGCLFDYFKG
jgi:hypothetical protein